MVDIVKYCLLVIRYKELLAKSERQRKQIAMLEKSRTDIRRAFQEYKKEVRINSGIKTEG